MGVSLGIDLGTSTTAAAIADEGGVRLLADADGAFLFPSVVAFTPTGEVLTGAPAKYRRPIDAANTLFSMKRIVGRLWTSEVVQTFRQRYPFSLSEFRGQPIFETRHGLRTPVEVMARLVERLATLLASQGLTATDVVVGVPADFAMPQREAVLEVLGKGGFPGAVCVDEPHAIARAYLQKPPEGLSRVVIYDLGGGTFNCAVCELQEGACRVVASGGDEYLGGDDIDQLCADWVNERALRDFHWDLRSSRQAHARLIAQCELAKIALSRLQMTRVKLGAIEQNEALMDREISIERGVLERLILDLVRRTFSVCDQVLGRAGLRAADVDAVLLAGGSTRIPHVQIAVQQYFGKRPRIDPNPEGAMALGAAVVAQERARAREKKTGHSPERRSPRVPVSMRVDVELPSGERLLGLHATDVSKGGMFIPMGSPLAIGSTLIVRIPTGDGVLLELKTRVVHRQEKPDGPRFTGMGVEFTDLTPDQRTALGHLIEQAPRLVGAPREG